MRRLTYLGLVTLAILSSLPTSVATQGTPYPFVTVQFFDNNGDPCNGCKLFAYAPGTTTARDTFSEITLTTANKNPVVMDSAGRPSTGAIYLSPTSYRFVLKDSAEAVTYWDHDNVPAIPATAVGLDLASQTAGEALSAGDVVFLSAGDGGQTAGRWYKADADNTYSSSTAGLVGIAPAAISSGATGSIRVGGRVTGLSSLTTGELYYVSATAGALTGTPPTNVAFVGKADTTTSLILAGGSPTLRLPDSDGTHSLVVTTSSNLTADRLLTIVPGDAARTLTLTGNATLNQDVSSTASPTFVCLTLNSVTYGTCPSAQAPGALTNDGAGVLSWASDSSLCHGRLTLTTATPVTTSDVTGAGTIYFTPYRGNRCSLYNGTGWVNHTFTERSLALTLTADKNYDVFLYNNSGTLTLELSAAWTNDTTRADAISLQDGVYVKTSATTRRYLGTIRSSGSNTTEDSEAKRFVWNYYNRVLRSLRRHDSTDSWTYTTATIRQANGSTSNQVAVVVGLAEAQIDLALTVTVGNGAQAELSAGIGEDSTTAFATGFIGGTIEVVGNTAPIRGPIHAYLKKVVPLGYHFYTWLEFSEANGNTTTWYGDAGIATLQASGLTGWIAG